MRNSNHIWIVQERLHPNTFWYLPITSANAPFLYAFKTRAYARWYVDSQLEAVEGRLKEEVRLQKTQGLDPEYQVLIDQIRPGISLVLSQPFG